MIFQCLESRMPLHQDEFHKRIPKLHHGSYSGRAGRDLNASLGELIWKHSELTGKYCGCQFWSVSAKRLFDTKLLELVDGRPPTSTDASDVACFLSKKIHGEKQLVHEHVFPRAELRALLGREVRLDYQYVAETIERLAVGCVVLENEHKLVNRTKGDSINPWRRYGGKIKLFENENWPISHPSHLELIKHAELLRPKMTGR